MAAVEEAVRRNDRELAGSAGSLPDLGAGVGAGWQVPWAIGTWIFASALSLPEKTRLEWSLREDAGGDELRCRAPDHPGRERLERRIADRVPGSRFERAPEFHSLILPAGSLIWRA
jgi:hypothetical protein